MSRQLNCPALGRSWFSIFVVCCAATAACSGASDAMDEAGAGSSPGGSASSAAAGKPAVAGSGSVASGGQSVGTGGSSSQSAGSGGALVTGGAGGGIAGGPAGGAGGAGSGGSGGAKSGAGGAGGHAGQSSGGTGGMAPTWTEIYTKFLVNAQYASNCNGAACHNPGKQKGYDFSSQANGYSSVKSKTSQFVSELSSGGMPQGKPKMPAADLAIIKAWVAAGAQNN